MFRDGLPEPKGDVLAKWQQTLFLRETDGAARGWLIEVMKVVERIGRSEFNLDYVYAFEQHVGALYPGQQQCSPHDTPQLQVLRDNCFLQFTGRGQYRLATTTIVECGT